MKYNYSGKRILITGGNSELAIELAKLLISENLFPVLAYRNEKSLLTIHNALSSYKECYGTCLCNYSDINILTSLSAKEISDIDYLVDFVHGDYETLLASAEDNDVCLYFEENVSFRALLLKRITRSMIHRKKGRCILVSSTAVLRPNPGQGFYASAKSASESLYRSIGIELGKFGITSATLRLGYVDSGRGKSYRKNHQELTDKLPFKRLINVNEVTETILFLLSDSAVAFNAVELTMDCGLSAAK